MDEKFQDSNSFKFFFEGIKIKYEIKIYLTLKNKSQPDIEF